MKVAVVGAGALGCELLSKLPLSKLEHLEKVCIIDFDKIEITNLSRQLLFRSEHLGQYKSSVACTVMSELFPKIQWEAQTCKVEDLPVSFFPQFDLFFCAVDSHPVRLWLNHWICGLSRPKILIEMGVEGMRGHVRRVISGITPCLYCTLSMYQETKQDHPPMPLCTLSSTPRSLEHCVSWALEIEWPKIYPNQFNPSSEDDLEKLTLLTKKRATEYSIEGIVNVSFVKSFLNIIPTTISICSVIAGLAILMINENFNSYNFVFVNLEATFHLSKHVLTERDLNCYSCT